MNVENKVFVVTGGGSGIGKALVQELLNKSAVVAVADIRKDELDALTKHASLSTHQIDISDPNSVSELLKNVIDTHGHVDGLINCAGIIQQFVGIKDLNYDEINKIMNVNFYGTLYMTKTFLPHLLERPSAHIVNVSSMGGFVPVPGQAIYCASKSAVKSFTEALYAELLDTNVRVSVVFPGATATNITKNSGVEAPEMPNSSGKKSSFPMLSADESARIIVRGIEKNKPQIYTGRDSRIMNILNRLSPIMAIKMIAKQMSSLLKKS